MENVHITTTPLVNQIRALTIKTGIYTSLGMIFYFLIMSLFKLHHYLVLHYFNIVVLFFGLRYVIKHIISIHGEIKYFEGLKAGLIVTLISVIVFNAFMVIYETIIEPSFLELLKENISFGNAFPVQSEVFVVMGVLIIEGLSSGFVLTFMLMQYYKDESIETK